MVYMYIAYNQYMLRFMLLANRLKNVERKGWIDKVNVSDPESVADHSYLVALISMILSDIKGYDTCKVLRLALIHDLAEALVGDHTPEDMDSKEKHMYEDKAMDQLLSSLPNNLKDRYKELWDDYVKRLSKESMLVHEVDKLEMAIQAKVYQEQGYDPKLLAEFYRSAEHYVKDSMIASILKDLKDIR